MVALLVVHPLQVAVVVEQERQETRTVSHMVAMDLSQIFQAFRQPMQVAVRLRLERLERGVAVRLEVMAHQIMEAQVRQILVVAVVALGDLAQVAALAALVLSY
jgi:hypothetical protein